MAEFDEVWPTNAIRVFVEELAQMEDIEGAVDRPLDPNDANKSLGVWAEGWQAPRDAYQIGSNWPILGVYTFKIDLMVKGYDRAETQNTLSLLTKRLRAMLYRDEDLQVRLKQLSETAFGTTERFKVFRVTRQDFSSGQLGDTHIAASTTTLTVETENS